MEQNSSVLYSCILYSNGHLWPVGHVVKLEAITVRIQKNKLYITFTWARVDQQVTAERHSVDEEADDVGRCSEARESSSSSIAPAVVVDRIAALPFVSNQLACAD